MATLRIHRRTHVSGSLLLYALVSMLIAVGAFNSQNNLLFWLFGLSLGMLVVSGFLSGMMLMAVRVERLAVEPQPAGGPLVIAYRISSVSRYMPGFALYLEELVEPGDTESAPVAEAAGGVSSVPRGFVAFVPAGGSVLARTTAGATARGRLRLAGVRITSSFPFGVVRKSMIYDMPGSLIILPALTTPLEAEPERAERHRHAPQSAGATDGGDDTFGLREYREGDSPRRIAWRSTARTGEIRTRLLSSSTEQPLIARLAVDSDATAEGIDRGVALAAAVGRASAARRRQFGLLLPDGGRIPARSGRGHQALCMTRLAVVSRVAPGRGGDEPGGRNGAVAWQGLAANGFSVRQTADLTVRVSGDQAVVVGGGEAAS